MTQPDTIKPINLLAALSEYADFHTAIFFTYGADLAFFETAVLYPLWRNGCRNIVLYMDAQRYADTLTAMRGSVTWVGRRYVVRPVRLESQRAFHPKLVLLLGPERGRLLIGSGNLTFTGWGHNREVYTCLDWTSAEPRLHHLFGRVWHLVQQVNNHWGYSTQADNILHKADYVAPWLHSESPPPDDIHFLHTFNGPLIHQLAQVLAGQTVRQLTVVTPFLDHNAAALTALYRQFAPAKLYLVLQPGRAVGDAAQLRALQAAVPLQVYSFVESAHYLHAKLLIFETDTADYVLSGSPNCTRAALLLPPEQGNVEVALLRRGVSRGQFAAILQGQMAAKPLLDLAMLNLRAGRVMPHKGDLAAVRLLDATITNGQLRIQYHVVCIPESIATLHLRLATLPPRLLPLDREGEASGVYTAQWSLAQEQINLPNRPCAVTLWGQDENHTLVDLKCNELWITHADVLQAQMMRSAIASTQSGSYLAEGVVASDEEWGALYETLAELIELDVAGLQRKGGTYTATPKKKSPAASEEIEKETVVRIVKAEELAAEQAQMAAVDVATLLFEESRFNAWLEYAQGRLPGAVRELPEPGEEAEDEELGSILSSGHKAGVSHTRHKWKPEARLGRRFVNLVRTYISSLHNAAYMQSISILHVLAYFGVFQRISWLLFEHEVLDRGAFSHLVLEINEGFFGGERESAPLLEPRLRQHIRRVWQAEWRTHEVAQYALASMALALHWIEQNEALGKENLLATRQVVRVLASIALVMDVKELIADPTVYAQVAEVYHQDEAELKAQIEKRIAPILPAALALLEGWDLRVNMDKLAAPDPERAKYVAHEQLDYQLAQYYILAKLGETDAVLTVCPQLLSQLEEWGEVKLVRKLEEDYIRWAKAAGQSQRVAQMFYRQGKKLYRSERKYADACDKLHQALAIAKSIEDKNLMADCKRMLGQIEVLLLLQDTVGKR